MRLSSLNSACPFKPQYYADEYVLTQVGRDFRPVLWALLVWGNKHFAPEGARVVVIDSKTGEEADPVLVDRKSGRPLATPAFGLAAGLAADARTRRRYRLVAAEPATAKDKDLR